MFLEDDGKHLKEIEINWNVRKMYKRKRSILEIYDSIYSLKLYLWYQIFREVIKIEKEGEDNNGHIL